MDQLLVQHAIQGHFHPLLECQFAIIARLEHSALAILLFAQIVHQGVFQILVAQVHVSHVRNVQLEHMKTFLVPPILIQRV